MLVKAKVKKRLGCLEKPSSISVAQKTRTRKKEMKTVGALEHYNSFSRLRRRLVWKFSPLIQCICALDFLPTFYNSSANPSRSLTQRAHLPDLRPKNRDNLNCEVYNYLNTFPGRENSNVDSLSTPASRWRDGALDLPCTFRDCHAFHICYILWVESLHLAPDKAITVRVSKVLREQKGYWYRPTKLQ